MKKIFITTLMAIAFADMSFAQTNTETEATVEKHQFAYNLLTNVSYEKSIGKKNDITFIRPYSRGRFI